MTLEILQHKNVKATYYQGSRCKMLLTTECSTVPKKTILRSKVLLSRNTEGLHYFTTLQRNGVGDGPISKVWLLLFCYYRLQHIKYQRVWVPSNGIKVTEFHEHQSSVSQVRLEYMDKHRNTPIGHGNVLSLRSSFPATKVGQTQSNGSYIMRNICDLPESFIPKIIVGNFTGVAVNLTRFCHQPLGQKRNEEFYL